MFVSAENILGLSDSALEVKFKETRWNPTCLRRADLTEGTTGIRWWCRPGTGGCRRRRLRGACCRGCASTSSPGEWTRRRRGWRWLRPPARCLEKQVRRVQCLSVQTFGCLTLILFITLQFPFFNEFHLVLHLYDSLTFAPTGYFMVLYIQSSRNKVYRSIKVSTAVMCASGKLSLVPQDLEMWSPGRRTEPHTAGLMSYLDEM